MYANTPKYMRFTRDVSDRNLVFVHTTAFALRLTNSIFALCRTDARRPTRPSVAAPHPVRPPAKHKAYAGHQHFTSAKPRKGKLSIVNLFFQLVPKTSNEISRQELVNRRITCSRLIMMQPGQ